MRPMQPPKTQAEFCLSAAEVLTRWHLDAVTGDDRIRDDDGSLTVHLVACAVYAVAEDAGLEDAGIVDAPLAAVLRVVEQRPVSAVQGYPGVQVAGFAGLGAELLEAFGSPAFSRVQERAAAVLAHHLADQGEPEATVGGRGPALDEIIQRDRARLLEEIFGTED